MCSLGIYPYYWLLTILGDCGLTWLCALSSISPTIVGFLVWLASTLSMSGVFELYWLLPWVMYGSSSTTCYYFGCQYMPSPSGFPLSRNIGNGHRNLLVPNIWYQLLVDPLLNLLSNGFPLFSKDSIVVLFSPASFMWNLKNIVISTATKQSKQSTNSMTKISIASSQFHYPLLKWWYL